MGVRAGQEDGSRGSIISDSAYGRPTRSTDLLRIYLRHLLDLAGATSASFFLGRSGRGGGADLLLHEGAAAPLPELATAAAARSFAERQTPPLAAGHQRGQDPDGLIFSLPASPSSSGPVPADESAPTSSHGWLGLRLADPAHSPMVGEVSWSEGGSGLRPSLLALGTALVEFGQRVSEVLEDPQTGLLGRSELERCLRTLQEKPQSSSPTSLLLLNPDGFSSVNQRLGRAGGDAVLAQIADRLLTTLGSFGAAFRYGGAVFALLLSVPLPMARRLAEEFRGALAEDPYREETAMTFSVGGVTYDPRDEATAAGARPTSTHLVRRADQALALAKLRGGNASVVLAISEEPESEAQQDRLSGIFTGRPSQDYRNMLLLWDTVSIVSSSADLNELAGRVVARLSIAYQADLVAAYRSESPASEPGLLAARRQGDEESYTLSQDEHELMRQAGSEGRLIECLVEQGEDGVTLRRMMVPFLARGRWLGALFLAGEESSLRLGPEDRLLLEALAGQLSSAIDRAALLAGERHRVERRQQRMRAEIEELRSTLASPQLVYRSAVMARLLDLARQVATTEVTLLVSGPSGTGKELLARTVHALSTRHQIQPAIVDCGAIATNLIERELFGYEKGAFAGAQEAVRGRLAEADGGTVILDEISELPLEVQSKLLRFVQEKEVTPVGGRCSTQVDVRVIAVTNRDLAAEVAAGNFRADLYHRLNVVHLTMPALSERVEDIPLLARYFLEKFANRHHKEGLELTAEAEAALVTYPWPGNVRELENRILQAVVLSDGDRVGVGELRLVTPPGEAAASGDDGALHPGEQPWAALRRVLSHQIEQTLAAGGRPAPLGRWLGADLTLVANELACGVISRGANLLGVPESTFRRRLSKAEDQARTGEDLRAEGWPSVLVAIEGLLEERGEVPPEDLPARARAVLLEEVLAVFPDDTAAGAALMGVTQRTFQTWSQRL